MFCFLIVVDLVYFFCAFLIVSVILSVAGDNTFTSSTLKSECTTEPVR